jgi:hypothetical protein
VETAARWGSDTLNRVADHVDQVLSAEDDNLRLPAFRRTFALASYKFKRDRHAALSRITWEGSVGGEGTPGEHFDAVAEEAIALTRLGEPERAKILLRDIHQQGLGYALAPKKDPQYILWRDAFDRACREDNAGIPHRVAMMTRLVTGMSDTEGRAAAQRVVTTILKWAPVGGVSLANATVDRIEQEGLACWPDIVEGVARGVTQSDAQLAACAAVTFARLGLPFASEQGQTILGELVEIAPDDQVDFVVTLGLTAAAVDGHLGFRSNIMENIAEKARARGRPVETEIATRWQDDAEFVKPVQRMMRSSATCGHSKNWKENWRTEPNTRSGT